MSFLDPNSFLLPSAVSRRLYSEVAGALPIVDFHTHIDPARFAENRPFEDVAELWLSPDPYKWRAMRMNGVPERLITGDAVPKERFAAWASTLGMMLGNPLFEWSHLELQQFFGIRDALDASSATRLWDEMNERLEGDDFLPRNLLKKAGVKLFMTSDGWLDSLEPHCQVAREEEEISMQPSLRMDAALNFSDGGFAEWVEKLSDASGQSIRSIRDYLAALVARIDFFEAAGCLLADVAVEGDFYRDCSESRASSLFAKRLSGSQLEFDEERELQSFALQALCIELGERNWIFQLHIGAIRSTSARLEREAGASGGFACIGSPLRMESLVRFLGTLEERGSLPRVIIYPMNPGDFEMVASVSGSFCQEGVRGKAQLGAAWWYNDHQRGLARHLEAVAHYSSLCHFMGMVTDSRSFLSATRHSYFRRVLCSKLAEWIDCGSAPDDPAIMQDLMEAVCYRNALETFETRQRSVEANVR